jgi:hypothetical protein
LGEKKGGVLVVLPFADGKGILPDSRLELAGDIMIIVFVVGAFTIFSGLDAQINYVVESPTSYFSVAETSNDVVISEDQISELNFATKNRIGFNSVGDEIGFCGGIRSDGTVYDLRVAEGLETSRDMVKFSCSTPRSFIVHSQPYSGELSEEDKSFEGEFRPEVTCILYEEVAASMFNDRVSGLNCWSVPDQDDGSFEVLTVKKG